MILSDATVGDRVVSGESDSAPETASMQRAPSNT
jgi:hypothetical protein